MNPSTATSSPSSPLNASIRERLSLGVTPELYDTIRRLWINHSKAEDKRDLQGLIDTLTEDCVYEIPATGQRWVGHDGAREFYTSFLGAFPDVHFDLTDIVIGPQGVFEVADMTGTQLGSWAGVEATGNAVRYPVIIYFPWDNVAKKFSGEKIYYDQNAGTGKAS